MPEEFIYILEKSKSERIIPFLQSLDDDQKKALVPQLKELSKEYLEFHSVRIGLTTTSHKQKANDAQKEILLLSSFVCYSRTEFEKVSMGIWIIDEKYFRKLMDWYCPAWFNDYVNKQAQKGDLPYFFSYNWAVELTEREIIKLPNSLLVRYMPQMIFENKDRKWFYKPENVLKHAITLQEHIWHLFEEDSNIHYSDRWMHFGNEPMKKEEGWIMLFKDYSTKGRIDRARLLKESLLASNRNFNKVLSGWFCELFTNLEPNTKEIVQLQKELFSVLNAPHSKAVNTSLQCIKKILTEKEFDTAAFLDHAPVLLTSATKNTVTSGLMILEKIAKKNAGLQAQVCKLVASAFIHSDDELQTRAAKLIAAYKDKLDGSFAEELQQYSLLSYARKLLESLHEQVETTGDVVMSDDNQQINDPTSLQEIILPETIDDLIFLCSQAFDNNQSWYIDILPAAIIKWQEQLRGENINRLEPALQRALQLTRSDFRSAQGILDHMLAIFFIDVCIFLVRAYPAESEALSEFFHNYNAQKSTHWLAIEEGIFYMEGWDNHSHDPIFTIHKQLLTTALQKITTKDGLPLLSTPTHEPAWIHPETLVKRILLYEKDGLNIFNIDAQVAFSRCLLTDTANAISLVEKQLTGEYKNLLLFLFGKHKQPLGPFENMAAWICCSVALKEKKTYKEFEGSSFYKKSFANYTGRFSWQSVDEEYLVDRYDHSAQKMVKHTDRRKIIRIQIDRSVSKESTGLKKFFSSLLQKPKAEPLLIYDLLEVKGEWVTFENDGRRLTMLFPNNPEPFLAIITNRYLSSPIFFSESYKKTVIPCQQALFEIWEEPGEMAYLFLGTCMLSPDKTIINIAGETWIKAVNIGKMNNEMLGHIIGSHERIEFAPLKRFTDMVSQVLYNISATHNKNLRSLLESILIELPDSPIKNIKKLLELYYELCSAQDHVINDARLQVKLNMWETNTGLQKIIKMLREQEL